jgi:putative ABC transport system permease protein
VRLLIFSIPILLIPLFFLWRLRTGLVKAMLVATLRMIVQLAFISIYLRYLFEWNNPWVNMLWVIIMALIATHTTVSRTSLPRSIAAVPVFVGMFVAAVLVGGYTLAVVMGLDNVFAAQYFIPIMGILMGNMLGVNVLTLSTFYSGIAREHATYYYLLGNGATRFEAWLPFMREAVIKSFTPCIANMAVMGIVALPGTMIGQILGGSAPDVAVKYQMMIVIITMTASMLSLILTLFLSTRQAFDAFGRLGQVMR